MKHYLVHTLVNPNPNIIQKILEDGYLYASSETGQTGLFGHQTLNDVYLSLLGSTEPFHGGFNFILDSNILNRRTFRYALAWIGEEIERTTKVNPRYDDVRKVLRKIDKHIGLSERPIVSHEILLKNRVNLDKYLVAVCCSDMLSFDNINYLRTNYPDILVLDAFPESASELREQIRLTPPTQRN